MTRSSTNAASIVAFSAWALLVATHLHADEPDALPRPRARAPQALGIPAEEPKAEAPKAPDQAGNEAGAELPRPTGKPGRAPDPDGKDDGAKKDATKDDAKKEPPPPDGRCDECGSCRCVAKVCVPTLKEKEITKVCWDAKCEDFCVPGPSEWCGTTCGKDDCGCWSHEVWKPTCAEVRTRVVPVRKTTKRKVPTVEWKVVERCACCRAKAPCGEMPKREADGTSPGTTSTAAAAAEPKSPSGEPAAEKPDGAVANSSEARTAPKTALAWPWATWWR